ncbi:MAG: RluA family pseudouridine synthase [Bacilli bacterium]|nr:RluA family pseudouridine synthase [Bacilli bacterium]
MIVEDKEGMRIDSYLSEQLDVSRSKIQKLIKEEKVLVNGKKINASYPVQLNDSIEIDDELNYEIHVEPENIPLDIVYEDDDLLIINKVSGMVVHPAPGHYTGTLVNALLYRYGSLAGDKFRPGIVHRLDKDTSGLMLVAKNEWTLEKLSEMISTKDVERKYLAIVDGVISHDTGEIDAPIGRDLKDRQKMAVTDVNSKEAITYFRVLERFAKHSLLECTLKTGRTHQIRVHMAYIGHPVSNDPLYGKGRCSDFGQMLHSYSIRLLHPRTGKELFFTSDPPLEFQEKLEELRNTF